MEAETAAEDAQPLVDQDVVPGVLAVPAKPKQVSVSSAESLHLPFHLKWFDNALQIHRKIS